MAAEPRVHVVQHAPVEPHLARTIRQAALAALRAERGDAAVELTVALVCDEEMRELNRAYRGVDAETDVLSFGLEEGPPVRMPPGARPYLGDVVISLPRACAQAHEYGHSAARELAFLTAHGVLHLLGHDHEEPEPRRRMRAAEAATLARLGLAREGV